MRKEKEVDEYLERFQLDAILVSDPYNMRYFSGFSGGEGYVLMGKGERTVLTDFRYTTGAKEETEDGKVLEVKGEYGEFLRKHLKELGVQRMGFEGKHVRYMQYVQLRDALRDVELYPLEDELTSLRSVKTKEELERIQKASGIGDQVFTEILHRIRTGMTERDVANQIEYLLKQYGAEGTSFDVIVASGPNSSKPHAHPTDKRIDQGDFVTMDFGCRYQGYCSDMTRTVVMGKASGKQREIYQTVRKAQEMALESIRSGLRGKEVDRVAREYIKNSGYGENFGHGLGHAVGLEIHESPRLSPTEEGLIRTGMVETVEPGIYIEGFGGVRIEDLVVVTEEGHINYTHSAKELIEL